MYHVIRYIDNLGGGVWTVVATATSFMEADRARDFFEANWPSEQTAVAGLITYSYDVMRADDATI